MSAEEEDEIAAAIAAAEAVDAALRIKAGAACQKRKRGAAGHAPSTTVSEKERLAEGLSTAIDDSNRGFALLKKSGWVPGTGSGKGGAGRTEPVPVVVLAPKVARTGLGSEARTEFFEHAGLGLSAGGHRDDSQAPSCDPTDWQSLLAQRSASVGKQRELSAACKQLRALAAAALDAGAEPDAVDEVFGDPSCSVAQEAVRLGGAGASDEAAADGSPSTSTRLGEEGRRGSSSVAARADSGGLGAAPAAPARTPTTLAPAPHHAASDAKAAAAAFLAADTAGRLALVLARMRAAHAYCFYCGEQFRGAAELEAGCPGPAASDHD